MAADRCYAVTNNSVFSKDRQPWSNNRGTYNYSDLFAVGSPSSSFSNKALLTGYGWCTEETGNIYHVSPTNLIAGGLYLHFIDTANKVDDWLLVKSVPTSSSSSGTTIVGIFDVNKMNVRYTLTISYVGQLSAIPDEYIETTSSSVTIPTMVITSEKRTSQEAFTAWKTNTWGSKQWLAYEELTIVYQPVMTTCEVPDQIITLDKTSIDNIRNGTSPKTPFVLNFSCRGGVNQIALNDIDAWLYSADSVNDSNTILRNSASTSHGIGINLFDESGKKIVVSDSLTSIGEADRILDIDEDDIFSDTENVSIYAGYSIYESNPQPGSVEATATVIINYD